MTRFEQIVSPSLNEPIGSLDPEVAERIDAELTKQH